MQASLSSLASKPPNLGYLRTRQALLRTAKSIKIDLRPRFILPLRRF